MPGISSRWTRAAANQKRRSSAAISAFVCGSPMLCCWRLRHSKLGLPVEGRSGDAGPLRTKWPFPPRPRQSIALCSVSNTGVAVLEPFVSGVVGETAHAARDLEMRMLNPLFALSLQAARFGLEMQSVMALRLMRLMGGGASARSEARRGVSEKTAAFAEAQTSATTVSINNGNDSKVGKTDLSVYKKRRRANKRRLSK